MIYLARCPLTLWRCGGGGQGFSLGPVNWYLYINFEAQLSCRPALLVPNSCLIMLERYLARAYVQYNTYNPWHYGGKYLYLTA